MGIVSFVRAFRPPPQRLAVVAIALALSAAIAEAETATLPPLTGAATATSSNAETIYAAARPRLLQVRTLVSAAGRQSTIGSGFLVSADGLAITNYHVVSQYALEPDNYRLEYATADGARGKLELLAFDVADDLAVVRLDRSGGPFFTFDERALQDQVPKGEQVFSMGNPLDLGFTIVEGTYNGLVERSYTERIHFSGAINPGMSGGPAVAADGRIVGINVAKNLGGELVSFLVPARFAAALLRHAETEAPLSPQDFTAEIGRQLAAWQAKLYGALADHGFRETGFGRYEAPEIAAPWVTCWAHTNADQVPKPRASINATNCTSESRLFVADDLSTGVMQVSHTYYRSRDLNAFQFANYLTGQTQAAWYSPWSPRWQRAQRCREDFVDAASSAGPPLRVVWCARAYSKFPGLYDVVVSAVTQDRTDEALVSRFSLQCVTFDSAIALTRRFLAAVQWAK